MDKKGAEAGVFLLESLDSIFVLVHGLKIFPMLWKGNFDDNMQMLHMILFGKKAKTIELSCLYSHKDRRQTLTNFGFRMSRKNKRQNHKDHCTKGGTLSQIVGIFGIPPCYN
ncbi:hypothetical protein V6N13_122478 [Hibiscus sabdariffa]